MTKREVKIQFKLDHIEHEDDNVSIDSDKLRKKRYKIPIFRSKSSDSAITRQELDANNKSFKQKSKLVEYLHTEKPIVQKVVEIDTEERKLLDLIGSDNLVNLDKYFKFPELKAKKKLWRIPYFFRSNSEQVDYGHEGPNSINRFGEGVSDGCTIGLNLNKTTKKVTTWDDIIETSEEVLEQFENAKWSRLTRTRRGSILQPQHVFLTPNPEMGCGEKFLLSNKFATLREWTSELQLYWRGNIEPLLEPDYKQSVCKNTSIQDLSHMLYPELKANLNNYGSLSNSELQYIQSVNSRRRQSLVPPNFSDGPTDLRFRRQSFSGGQLWSARVEINNQREVYQQKLRLINPDYDQKWLRKSKSIVSNCESIDIQSFIDANEPCSLVDYPHYKLNSAEQTRLFAHELTLIVRQYFHSIKSSEIVNFMTHSGPNVLNACPNIKGLLHFQNRIIRVIATYILRHDQLEQRVAATLFFLGVIRELHRLGNWHSVNLVTQSLQCPPVVRMKETWRKITFKYADTYCFFIQMSEDLASGRQLLYYEQNPKFIPIFDDVIEQIKEKCGLIIVQINQHRLRGTWDNLHNDDIAKWINDEIDNLVHDWPEQQTLSPPTPSSNHSKKFRFFQRIFHKSKRSIKSNGEVKGGKGVTEPDEQNDSEGEEEMNKSDIYQHRLFTGQVIPRVKRQNSHVPSCKKFWSTAEFYKMREEDREIVKQQMVRTMVMFQKKTFYVFEDRDEEIRDFLLNSPCDTMDACMQRSRSIESEHGRKTLNGHYNEHHSDTDNEQLDTHQQEINNESSVNLGEEKQEPQPRRRVMFA